MSVKLAVAKLSATAAGVALMTGGAVRVAEPMATDDPAYTTDADGKLVESKLIAKSKYIKEGVPDRRVRIIDRTSECVPVEPEPAFPSTAPLPILMGASIPLPIMQFSPSGTVVETYFDSVECPPITRVAYAPAPLPPLPPVRGGGGSARLKSVDKLCRRVLVWDSVR